MSTKEQSLMIAICEGFGEESRALDGGAILVKTASGEWRYCEDVYTLAGRIGERAMVAYAALTHSLAFRDCGEEDHAEIEIEPGQWARFSGEKRQAYRLRDALGY